MVASGESIFTTYPNQVVFLKESTSFLPANYISSLLFAIPLPLYLFVLFLSFYCLNHV
jgi:hypothetical protein